MPATLDRKEILQIVADVLSDQSGLWLINDKRRQAIADNLSSFSFRVRPTASEMIEMADSGERFWKPTVEYYTVFNELKKMMVNSRGSIKDALETLKTGAKNDRVEHREWVKKTIDFMTKLSLEHK